MKICTRPKGFTLVELLIVVAVICLILAISMYNCINTTHGTGEKIGQVVKLSKEGFISDTWEGQLIRGGMNGGSGAFGTVPFDFTVADDTMAASVQKYLHDQTEVIITYRIAGFYSPFSSENKGVFLVSIEPAKK